MGKKRGIKTCLTNGSATLKRSICFLSRPLIYVSENSIASAPRPPPSFSASLAGNEGPRRPRRLVWDSGLPGCQGTSYGTRSCVNQRKIIENIYNLSVKQRRDSEMPLRRRLVPQSLLPIYLIGRKASLPEVHSNSGQPSPPAITKINL